jgi:hypothetical protein
MSEKDELLEWWRSEPLARALREAERRGWQRCREAAAQVHWRGMVENAPFKSVHDAIRHLPLPEKEERK